MCGFYLDGVSDCEELVGVAHSDYRVGIT